MLEWPSRYCRGLRAAPASWAMEPREGARAALAPRFKDGGRGCAGPHADRRSLPGVPPLLDPPVGPHLGVRFPVTRDLDMSGRVGLEHSFADREVQRRPQGGA